MPEIKNTFLKSKMNKDLDDRIIPNGEYRDGQNIAVSKSEESDVGALENALGNLSVADLGGRSVANVSVIGKYMDPTNDRVIAMVTDYIDTSSDKLSNFAPTYATCRIVSYYPNTNTSFTLSQGNFLNFSKTHPITGINLIENLLFWTDDRNQPRKININTAETEGSTYYNNEDKISIAKYYPWQAIQLLEDSGIAESLTVATGGSGYTAGVGIATSGGTGSGLTVNTGVSAGALSGTQTINVAGTGYVNGDVVTVAGGSGGTLTVGTNQLTTMKDVVSEQLPDPSPATLNNIGGVNTGYSTGTNITTTGGSGEGLTIDIDTVGGSGDITAVSINQAGHGYEVGDTVNISGGGGNATVDVATIGTANPYYNANWPGDPDYLKDRFVRFSYRFKFDNGEYSLIAPFTQICFVPKQDGYFLRYDETRTFKSTEAAFMENKVNDITLVIPCPIGIPWNNLFKGLKVTHLDIVYKEAGSAAIKVVETLNQSDFPSANFLTYNYQSQKPIKTLPEREVVRVFDRVPIRALSQEVTGNRVVYGNYVDKHTPPDTLDYNVNAGEKDPLSVNSYSRVEYQNHTLKQNRTYQVGIVLSDRYGRQSDVILSSANSSVSPTVKASTFFHPYRSSAFTNTDLISNTDTWPGDSMKVIFNNLIPSSVSTPGYPGLYDSATNPLGWYSYKIVVKQIEQDYYNVYLPGILNGWTQPTSGADVVATAEDPVGHIMIFSDNINKMPRDLREVGPDQKQFRAARPTFEEDPSYYAFDSYYDSNGNLIMGYSFDPNTTDPEELAVLRERDRTRGLRTVNAGVLLWGRVTNFTSGTDVKLNKRINPGSRPDSLVAIGTGVDMGLWDPAASTPTTALELYDYTSNPLIGRLELEDWKVANIGAAANATTNLSMRPALSVYETEPGESNLEIFWETSTSGLISELNTNILNSDTDIPSALESVTSLLNENLASGNPATNNFRALNGTTPLTGASMELNSIIDGYGTNVTGNFELTSAGGGAYYVETDGVFWYGSDAKLRTYTCTVKVTNSGIISYLDFKFRMSNTAPSITDPTGSPTATAKTDGSEIIETFVGENGSSSASLELNELQWEVISQVHSGSGSSVGSLFYMEQNGNLRNYDVSAYSMWIGSEVDIVVQLTDGGGLTTTQAITVTLSS